MFGCMCACGQCDKINVSQYTFCDKRKFLKRLKVAIEIFLVGEEKKGVFEFIKPLCKH